MLRLKMSNKDLKDKRLVWIAYRALGERSDATKSIARVR
jgi:hypothetical protein